MKILLLADAGAHTGFGTVTHNIFERMVSDYGHEVHVLACNYQGDPWDTNLQLYVPNFAERADILGQSRIVEMMGKLMPDAVGFIQDPQVVMNVLHFNPWDKAKVLANGIGLAGTEYAYKPPIVAYLAIDGYDNPRSWDVLKDRVTRVAMSAHGKQAMPEAPVVWHGVDTSVFHPPADDADKRRIKASLGYDPDRFLVLRVDKNSWRKDYPSTWRALTPVLRRHPDIDVHFHCRTSASDGYDLANVRWNDEDIRDRVNFTQNLGGFVGVPGGQLADLYRAADLFVSTSWGEGFGLTILEAMASGLPVIAQDCSAITELVGDAGILVKPEKQTYVPMGQKQCLPDVEKFSYWIEHLYGARKMRESLGRAAVERASRYSWDEAARRMNDIYTKAVETATARPKPTLKNMGLAAPR